MKKRMIAFVMAFTLSASPFLCTAAADDNVEWTEEFVPEDEMEENPDGAYIVDEDGADFVTEDDTVYDDYTDDVEGDYDMTFDGDNAAYDEYTEEEEITDNSAADTEAAEVTEAQLTDDETRDYVEKRLDIYNVKTKWDYDSEADCWILNPTAAVAYPEIAKDQGISVAVPGAYVAGIDTDRDLEADVTADQVTETIVGDIIIDYDAYVVSSNGQTYDASTAPVIINTGAMYGAEQQNRLATTEYAGEGFVNVYCGNRGRQSQVTADNGTSYFTGDFPLSLVDLKNAVRFMKYNILLGNLPGSLDRFVASGSSEGSHAVLLAVTSADPVFYEYEHDAGAAGIYKNSDGSFFNSVNIFGDEVSITDGVWGAYAVNPVTLQEEGEEALAFEYMLDPAYEPSTEFGKKMSEYLADLYPEYINSIGLAVSEADVGIDLSADGDFDDQVDLVLEKNEDGSISGSYLDFYITRFELSLDRYIGSLAGAEGWTWFGGDGKPLTDEEVASMSETDRAAAFIEGRYALPASGEEKGSETKRGSRDSKKYKTFDEMLISYREDIESIEAGDRFGNRISEFADPMRWAFGEGGEKPAWIRMVTDISTNKVSLFNSLNLEAALLNKGIYVFSDWRWDVGGVPAVDSADSLPWYVDRMFGRLTEGAAEIGRPEIEPVTVNGTAAEADGADISGWVNYDEELGTSFSIDAAAAVRTADVLRPVPGFDMIDYGGENYMFGDAEKDARHWNRSLLSIMEMHEDDLSPLFAGPADEKTEG